MWCIDLLWAASMTLKMTITISFIQFYITKCGRKLKLLSSGQFLLKKERTNLFFYPNNSEILQTWILISSFQVVPGHRIEEQICMFVFWEKLRLNFFFRDLLTYNMGRFAQRVADSLQLIFSLTLKKGQIN